MSRPDVPMVDQQTFLLTSCMEVEGGPSPYPTSHSLKPWSGYGNIQQAPTIRSRTGFSSAPSGYVFSNDDLRITAVPGDKTISFTVAFNKHRYTWSGATAAYTVTTKGEREPLPDDAPPGTDPDSMPWKWEPVTMAFSFPIVVRGYDWTHMSQTHFELKVGDVVDISLSPTSTGYGGGVLEVHDHAIRPILHWDAGTISNDVFTGLYSGLYTMGIWTTGPMGGDFCVGLRICGRAIRPGVYVLNFFTEMKYPNEFSWWSFGSGVPYMNTLVFSIIDGYFNETQTGEIVTPGAPALPDLDIPGEEDVITPVTMEGTHVMALDCPYKIDRAILRATRRGNDINDLLGPFTGFSRSVRQQSFSPNPLYYEWQFVKTPEQWELQFRQRLVIAMTGQEEVEPWQTIATSTRNINVLPDTMTAGVFATGAMPPNGGWTNDTWLAGCTEYYFEGHGFFDFKGEAVYRWRERVKNPDTGAIELGAWVEEKHPYYEQQPRVHPQYDTVSPSGTKTGTWWQNPPAVRNDDGYCYWFFKPQYTDNFGIHYIADEGEWRLTAWDDDTEIRTDGQPPAQPMPGTVLVPYSPPTCELYGDIPVRDLVLAEPGPDAVAPADWNEETDGPWEPPEPSGIVINGSSTDFQAVIVGG